MQFFANDKPEILNTAIHQATKMHSDEAIQWRSPLKGDDYAEYFDQAFLDRLGIEDSKKSLLQFWPRGGPHWDGLAITSKKQVILVEAKANIAEFATHPCGAKSPKSVRQILESLGQVQQFMHIEKNRRRPELWANAFYQYTNRIAHLYFLRELNCIPTHMIFLDIINDPDSGNDAVKSADEWRLLVRLAEGCLGITPKKPLMKHVHHIHLDVSEWDKPSG